MSTHAVRSGVIAAAASRLCYAALTARPPGGRHTWDRTNHRGEPITLLEGPAVAIGMIAGAVASGGDSRDRMALAVAGAGAAAFGGYDDHAGNGVRKGFRGHLGALRSGELTTGAVKIAGIGATGLAAALIAGPAADAAAEKYPSAPGAIADVVINAGLVAGGANLLNLFDLRPGRAIKVALLTGGLLASSRRGRAAVASPLAAAAAMLPEDLGERAMLGDSGANALGAVLGAAAAMTLPRSARLGLLAAVAGLTAASEKVSFTKVIERSAPLRRLDMLGRRPPAAAASAEQASSEQASSEQASPERASTEPASTEPPSPATDADGNAHRDPADGAPGAHGRRSAEAR